MSDWPWPDARPRSTGLTRQERARRWRLFWLGALGTAAVLALAVLGWRHVPPSPGTALDDGPSQGGGGSCVQGAADPATGELTWRASRLGTSRSVELLDVRLVDPRNLSVIEATVVPVIGSFGDRPAVVAAPPTTLPWDEIAGTLGELDWSRARAAEESVLRTGSPVLLVLQLRVDDVDQDASYRGIELAYTDDSQRKVQRFETFLVLPGGGAECTDDWAEPFWD